MEPGQAGAGGSDGFETPHRAPKGDTRFVLTREVFAERYRSVSKQLWVVAVAIVRDGGLAEDVVQEAAIVALGKLDQFEEGTSFEAWMSQIVRFTALNANRKKARRGEGGDPDGLDRVPAGATSSDARPVGTFGQFLDDQSAFDDQVNAALADLDETARACLLLRTVEDVPYSRISEMLGIPEGTAMSHVHRARKALRDALAKAAASRGGGR